MRIYNLFLPLLAFTNLGAGFFQSIGKPKTAVAISLSRQVLCMIPLIIIFGMIFGQNGVLYSLPGSDVITAVISGALLIKQCRAMRKSS